MDLIFTVFCFYYFEKHVVRGRESAGNKMVRLRGFRVTTPQHSKCHGVEDWYLSTPWCQDNS